MRDNSLWQLTPFLPPPRQHEETCRQPDFEGITINQASMQQAFYQWLQQVRQGQQPNPRTFTDVRWPGDHSCWLNGFHGSC